MQEAYGEVESDLQSAKDIEYPLKTGSTSTTVVITPSHVVFAHIGDSAGLFMRNDKAYYVTEAHTVENEGEVARIRRTTASIRGGYVYDTHGSGKMTTRCFGDFHLKADAHLSPGEQALIATPETKVIERTEEDNLVMVASDGLWDCHSPSDVVYAYPRFYHTRRKYLLWSLHQMCKVVSGAGGEDNIAAIVFEFPSHLTQNV